VFSFNEYLYFITAYLIGSISFGIIVTRLAGIKDITKHGSGNIGATNVTRVAGKKLGTLCFLLDFAKCYVPTTIYMFYLGTGKGTLIFAGMVVVGHIFSIFNRFKGGKGVASSFGAIMAIDPVVALATIGLWLVCFAVTRISSVAALFSFSIMPFLFFAMGNSGFNTTELFAFSIILSIIIYLRHLENIKNLLSGTEKGFK